VNDSVQGAEDKGGWQTRGIILAGA